MYKLYRCNIKEKRRRLVVVEESGHHWITDFTIEQITDAINRVLPKGGWIIKDKNEHRIGEYICAFSNLKGLSINNPELFI